MRSRDRKPFTGIFFAALAALALFTGNAFASDAYGEIIKTKTFTLGETVELDLNTSMSAAELNLQWYKDGEMLSYTGKHFRKENAVFEDAGIYTVTYDFCHASHKKSIIVVVNDINPAGEDLAGEDGEKPLKGLESSAPNYGFSLMPNEPNPFEESTLIRFAAQKEGPVQISVVDMLGNRVAVLFDGNISPGIHQVEFFPGDYNVSSGLYYYTLTAPGFNDSKPMMIVK